MKFTWKKRVAAAMLGGAMVMSLTACGGDNSSDGGNAASGNNGDVIELQIGFENSISEPIGQGIEKWAELLEEASGGTMTITPYLTASWAAKTS